MILSFLPFLSLSFLVSATFKPLPEIGISFNFLGYRGSDYSAIRYLPQCGHLGGGLGTKPFAIGDRCDAAMSAFNASNELAAFYSLDGHIQPQLENGTESCLCMGLQDTYPGMRADRAFICLWVGKDGNMESIPLKNSVGQVTMEEGYVGSFLPGVKRSLLLCLDVDVAKIKAENANSTLPPTPIRDTNKIPACVSCEFYHMRNTRSELTHAGGNSSSTSVDNTPPASTKSKISSAVLGTVLVVLFLLAICGGGYKIVYVKK